MAEYGMETTTIAQQEKVHKHTIYKKTDAYSFLDLQGSVMEHYLERGTTIPNGQLSEMLTDRLKPAIRSKCRGPLTEHVLFHGNAHTAEILWKLKFVVVAHPLFSPDLAPSDCYLFGPLKEALRAVSSPRSKK
jgi:hypothetical protein